MASVTAVLLLYICRGGIYIPESLKSGRLFDTIYMPSIFSSGYQRMPAWENVLKGMRTDGTYIICIEKNSGVICEQHSGAIVSL